MGKFSGSSPVPYPSFPCFLEFLVFSPCEDFIVFLTVFPFFSRDFRGSVGIKNPCFFGGFPCLFSKKKKKTRKGRTGYFPSFSPVFPRFFPEFFRIFPIFPKFPAFSRFLLNFPEFSPIFCRIFLYLPNFQVFEAQSSNAQLSSFPCYFPSSRVLECLFLLLYDFFCWSDFRLHTHVPRDFLQVSSCVLALVLRYRLSWSVGGLAVLLLPRVIRTCRGVWQTQTG